MDRPKKEEYRTSQGLMVVQYDKAIEKYIDYLEEQLKAREGELPTDEEIEIQAQLTAMVNAGFLHTYSYKKGAKWLRDLINQRAKAQ